MITKEDYISYLKQIEEILKKIDTSYYDLYQKINDLEFKEMFLRLQGEKKIHLELIQELKTIIETKWK